jgi:hypothetical protein
MLRRIVDQNIPTASVTADTLVFTPTYNERESIGPLVDAVLAVTPACDLLVIDDGSGDGTAEYLRARAATDRRLTLLERRGKRGIDTAHKLGWMYARAHGYARIVTMDADLSHDPAEIPLLLAALDAGAEVALGSRFIPGGRLDYRGRRRVMSQVANRLAWALLGAGLHEYTTSFRAARLDRVPPGLVEGVPFGGYSFFLACIMAMARSGLAMAEVPIHFRDRTGGESKMPSGAIVNGVLNLLRHAVDRRAPVPAPPEPCTACGGPFRVTLPGRGGQCLACFGG